MSHHGQTAKISESLGMEKKTLQDKMWTLGMPSLHNVGASKSWRALIRFHRGDGLRRSCELEKVREKEVEDLMRKVSPRVVALAAKLVRISGPEVTSTINFPLRQFEYEAEVQNDPTESNQDFDRFIDSVVGGKSMGHAGCVMAESVRKDTHVERLS